MISSRAVQEGGGIGCGEGRGEGNVKNNNFVLFCFSYVFSLMSFFNAVAFTDLTHFIFVYFN